MAAVTVATGYPRRNVSGSMNEWLYQVDIASDGDYLDVPLKVVKDIHLTDAALTACGVESVALDGGTVQKSRITFNSGGAITGCYIRVLGW
jgi:hypothetical protein